MNYNGKRSTFFALELCLVMAAILFCDQTHGFGRERVHTRDLYRSKRSNSSTSSCGQCCDGLCTTLECISEAVIIEEHMNSSADPCIDFYEYACGSFYNTQRFKLGHTAIYSDSNQRHRNIEDLEDILDDEVLTSDPNYMASMKNFFSSCMDTDKVESVGLQPYLSSAEAREWPTLIGRDWCEEETFDLNAVSAKYAGLFLTPFFRVDLRRNLQQNNPELRLFLDEDPKEDKFPSEIFDLERNNPRLMAYERYLTQLAVELGADPVVAMDDAEAVVNLQIKLHKIRHPGWHRILQYWLNAESVTSLQHKFPYLDFPRILRAYFAAASIALDDNEMVIVYSRNKRYFHRLGTVLRYTDNRTLQNLFGFEFAKRNAMVTPRMRGITLELYKTWEGRKEEESRQETCVLETLKYYGIALGKTFSQRDFTQQAKSNVEEMLAKLKESFKYLLEAKGWFNDSTSLDKAVNKIDHMTSVFGYSDLELSEGNLTAIYDSYPLCNQSYYSNRQDLFYMRKIDWLMKLNTPLRPEDALNNHGVSPTDFSAFYSRDNVLYLSDAYLQEPHYSFDYSTTHNYASIGQKLAHFLSKTLDRMGVQVDFHGRTVSARTRQRLDYTSNFHCFDGLLVGTIPHYPVPDYFGVNAGDYIGLRILHRVWKMVLENLDDVDNLPTLGLDQDKLFYVAYAQNFCEKKTKERIDMEKHHLNPPRKFRVQHTLKNFPEFASVFQCPSGSPMNPNYRCTI